MSARVISLLDDRRRVDAPSAHTLSGLAAGALVAAAFVAERIHHSLEHVLGILF